MKCFQNFIPAGFRKNNYTSKYVQGVFEKRARRHINSREDDASTGVDLYMYYQSASTSSLY